MDVSRGHQPMSTSDGRLTITYNGEIFNHKEIREQLTTKGYRFETESDTETILHAFREFGADCLQYFRGMFAFAIWDE
ncbi:asparagine synthetase B, partial [Escherichia coli]|nr:asparagine synthetase B [Escherichia coli]